MKASSVITQLQTLMPQQNDLFTDTLAVTSMTRSGTTVTVVTPTVHKLSNNDYVNISGVQSPVLINSLTQVGKIVTGITATNHDITENYTPSVTIIGANQAPYNGTFPLLTSVNRKTFTFDLPPGQTSPATGTMYLLQNFFYGYNGWQQVTVIDNFTFTFQNTFSGPDFIFGTPIIHTATRISGAISVDHATAVYTQQKSIDRMWAFVVMGDTNSNKDRFVLTDAQAKIVKGQGFRQELIQNFSVFIFNPSTDTVGARRNYDAMVDLSVDMFKCLLGMLPDVLYTEPPQYGVSFIKHGPHLYNPAYYVHEFEFQIPYNIVQQDGVPIDYNVAFRDINLSFTIDDPTTIIQIDVNLDDEPLP